MQSLVNLPVFPRFKRLTLKERGQIEKFNRRYLPYSDFNFVSLWSYNINNDHVFSYLNGNLVLSFNDYLTRKPFYSFLGNSKALETIDVLLDYSKRKKIKAELRLIPQASIANLLKSPPKNLYIEEDENHNDYIISLRKTINLSNINPHKKEVYRNFLRNYPRHRIVRLKLSEKYVRTEIMKLFSIWAAQRKKTMKELRPEFIALYNLFDLKNSSTLIVCGLYSDGKLIGFTIDERLRKPYVMGHFIKTNFSYPGAFEVLNKLSAEMHYEKGYEFINIEQDLGIRGLRISKRQRNPVNFLKKYIIKRK